MLSVRVSLVLLATFSASLAGNLEEKWFKDLKKAQDSYRNGQTQTSSLNTADFQTKKFETGLYGDFKNTALEKKTFTSKEFNTGKANDMWGSKKFAIPENTAFASNNSGISTDQTFATGTSSLDKTRVLEDKKAKEDGVKAILEREKSVLADMRYSGPEVEKIGEEVKLINETLKNKEDLKDHRISIREIREILNKN